MGIAATFVDAHVEAAFRRDGYVVVDLFSRAEAAELAGEVAGLARTTPNSFAATLYSDDVEYRRAVDEHLRPRFAAALDPHLHEQRCFTANLLVKPPGEDTELGIHQDWTFVDEDRATSATAWCALTDTTERNGTLVVMVGSNRLGRSWRGSPRIPGPFDGLEQQIHASHGTPVACRAGQALVYDHRTVHWSGPNRSDADRPVVGVGIAPAAEPLIHLHADESGAVTCYEVPDDFLADLDFGAPPRRYRDARPFEVPATAVDLDHTGPRRPTRRAWWGLRRRTG